MFDPFLLDALWKALRGPYSAIERIRATTPSKTYRRIPMGLYGALTKRATITGRNACGASLVARANPRP